MHYRIIGDIHGCLNTFEQLLKTWDPETEILIQVGDLVDRGRFIPETVALARRIQSENPDGTVFLRGNHEDELITLFESGYDEKLLVRMGSDTLIQYRKAGREFMDDFQWLESLPLYFEDPYLFVSHAGISVRKPKILDSVFFLWHRDPLRNIGKVQVYGHTPLFDSEITHDMLSDSWNIDTACVYGGKLSALVLDEKGQLIKIDQIETDPSDRIEW